MSKPGPSRQLVAEIASEDSLLSAEIYLKKFTDTYAVRIFDYREGEDGEFTETLVRSVHVASLDEAKRFAHQTLDELDGRNDPSARSQDATDAAEPYAINVRAIVRALRKDPDAPDLDPKGWEIYEHDDSGVENERIVRCDQLVRVNASDVGTAIELAKETATAIEVPTGWEIQQITMWVDEDIDINPTHADHDGMSPPGM